MAIDPDDLEMLHGLKNRDPRSLAKVYDRFGSYVFSLARQICGNSSAAEEITQDVFSRVWKSVESYDHEKASLSTWIMSIARNRAIDEIRRRRNVRIRVLNDWESLDNFPSHVQDPGTAAIKDSERRRVRESLLSLPEEQREVVWFAFFAACSHSQIAEILDIPLGTVKTRIRLAMNKLRSILGDMDESGTETDYAKK